MRGDVPDRARPRPSCRPPPAASRRDRPDSARCSIACSRISSTGFGPYGKCAPSPTYRIDSFGSSSKIARATVSPPTPESKTPIGRSSPTRYHHRDSSTPFSAAVRSSCPGLGGQVLPAAVGEQADDVARLELRRDPLCDVDDGAARDAGEDPLPLGQLAGSHAGSPPSSRGTSGRSRPDRRSAERTPHRASAGRRRGRRARARRRSP